VIGVRNEDDPSANRDLGPGEAIGIPGSVTAFVVMQHALCHRVDPEAFEHSKANLGVLAQRGPLRRGKRCRLTQKVLREGELADVVEAGGELRELELLARK